MKRDTCLNLPRKKKSQLMPELGQTKQRGISEEELPASLLGETHAIMTDPAVGGASMGQS